MGATDKGTTGTRHQWPEKGLFSWYNPVPSPHHRAENFAQLHRGQFCAKALPAPNFQGFTPHSPPFFGFALKHWQTQKSPSDGASLLSTYQTHKQTKRRLLINFPTLQHRQPTRAATYSRGLFLVEETGCFPISSICKCYACNSRNAPPDHRAGNKFFVLFPSFTPSYSDSA